MAKARLAVTAVAAALSGGAATETDPAEMHSHGGDAPAPGLAPLHPLLLAPPPDHRALRLTVACAAERDSDLAPDAAGGPTPLPRRRLQQRHRRCGRRWPS